MNNLNLSPQQVAEVLFDHLTDKSASEEARWEKVADVLDDLSRGFKDESQMEMCLYVLEKGDIKSFYVRWLRDKLSNNPALPVKHFDQLINLKSTDLLVRVKEFTDEQVNRVVSTYPVDGSILTMLGKEGVLDRITDQSLIKLCKGMEVKYRASSSADEKKQLRPILERILKVGVLPWEVVTYIFDEFEDFTRIAAAHPSFPVHRMETICEGLQRHISYNEGYTPNRIENAILLSPNLSDHWIWYFSNHKPCWGGLIGNPRTPEDIKALIEERGNSITVGVTLLTHELGEAEWREKCDRYLALRKQEGQTLTFVHEKVVTHPYMTSDLLKKAFELDLGAKWPDNTTTMTALWKRYYLSPVAPDFMKRHILSITEEKNYARDLYKDIMKADKNIPEDQVERMCRAAGGSGHYAERFKIAACQQNNIPTKILRKWAEAKNKDVSAEAKAALKARLDARREKEGLPLAE